MTRYRKTAIALAAGLIAAGSLAQALDALRWRLADYPDGGQALTAVVAETLIGSGEFIGPTCTALGPGTVAQQSSGIAGIAVSITASDADNAETIVDGIPDCCRVIAGGDADSRISLGVAVAQEARSLAETDLASAQEIELFVATCEDEVLGRSYELARGEDDLGKLIAEIDGPIGPQAPEIPINSDSGGGLATGN